MGVLRINRPQHARIFYMGFGTEYHIPAKPATFTLTISRRELGLLYSIIKFVARRYLPKMGGYGPSDIFGFARRLDRALGQAIDRHDACKNKWEI